MTESQKRREVNQWLSDNHKQLRINLDKLATPTNPLKEDLFACTVQQFLDKDTDKVYNICFGEGQKPEHYFTRMMALNLKSNTSMFYTKYRKPALNIREMFVNKVYDKDGTNSYDMDAPSKDPLFDDTPKSHTRVRRALDILREYNLYFHDVIIKLYVDDWSHVDYADFYQIPMHELRPNVTSARNKFKQIYKKLQNGDIE